MEKAGPKAGVMDRNPTADVRRELLFGGNEALDRQLAEHRNLLVDRVVSALALFAVVVVPASLLRSLNTGWHLLYTAHALLGIASACLYLVRHRLGAAAKALAVMALFWLTGLSALVGLGLAGSGMWWLVLGSLLASVLYSVRAGIAMMAIAVVVMAAVGTAFCSGLLATPGDPANFLRSPAAWATAIIGASVMPLLVFQAIAAINASTLELLAQAARQRERIRELATHDALTGVPGLMLALDRLDQALRVMQRSGTKVSLLYLDLDGFKQINDSLGHDAGNVVLQVVAQRMVAKLRTGDTVARIGGDEFLVLLTGPASEADVLCVANKILQAVNEPIAYREQEIIPRGSIGGAFVERAGTLAEDVVRAADAAMYEAKRAGGQQVRIAPVIAPGNESTGQ
jgi:diguanylate cyclase (GGDEF)-like protein